MNELLALIAIALTAFPSITINIWQGVKNIDNRLAILISQSRARTLLARVDELLYPHEVDIERSTQARLHAAWAPRVQDEERVRFLEPFGFKALSSAVPRPSVQPPAVVVCKSSGHVVSLVSSAEVSGEIDIEALVSGTGADLFDGYEPTVFAATGTVGPITEVRFAGGERRQFYGGQKLDIYLSETSRIERHLAREVRAGWQVIAFVDGQYDGLFRRLAAHRCHCFQRLAGQRFQGIVLEAEQQDAVQVSALGHRAAR